MFVPNAIVKKKSNQKNYKSQLFVLLEQKDNFKFQKKKKQ
jgi:hypothetical protein